MPSRVLVLDTETTGFSPQWSRIVEIAAVEVVSRTGQIGPELHHLVNPLVCIPAVATSAHGIRDSDVRDKPAFATIASEVVSFLRGATIAIHNAPFDVPMIDAELERAQQPSLADLGATIVDTLEMSRNVLPLLPSHDLDHICDHLDVGRAERTLHGALTDVRLLAATLPKFAAEYDAWRAIIEEGCATQLDDFDREFGAFVHRLIESLDVRWPQSIDRSLSCLAAAGRWIGRGQDSLKARVEELIGSDNWCCKHFSARWDISESISWKGIATAHLSEDVLNKYHSESSSWTLTPKADDGIEQQLRALQPMLDRLPDQSIGCALRGLVLLRRADKVIEEPRRTLRADLLRYVNEGYILRHATLREGARISTDYKAAVTECAPDANLEPYTKRNQSLSVRARDSAAFQVIFE